MRINRTTIISVSVLILTISGFIFFTPVSTLPLIPSLRITPTTYLTPVTAKTKACMDKLSKYKDYDYAPGQVLLTFRNNISLPRIETIMQDFSFKLSDLDRERINLHTFIVVKIPEGKEKELVCQLNELSEVESAELNLIARIN